MQSAGCSDVSPNSVCTHEDECPSMAGLPRTFLDQATASAVSEAGKVSDEDLIQTETVSVRASGRRARDPLPVRGLNN
jgi:hypothetical protein